MHVSSHINTKKALHPWNRWKLCRCNCPILFHLHLFLWLIVICIFFFLPLANVAMIILAFSDFCESNKWLNLTWFWKSPKFIACVQSLGQIGGLEQCALYFKLGYILLYLSFQPLQRPSWYHMTQGPHYSHC